MVYGVDRIANATAVVEQNRLLSGMIKCVQSPDKTTGQSVCNDSTCPTMSAGPCVTTCVPYQFTLTNSHSEPPTPGSTPTATPSTSPPPSTSNTSKPGSTAKSKTKASSPPHYGYGAGSRMCIGSHLANRELYTAFLRLVTAFEILPARKESERPILDCFGCNKMANGLTMDPKPFKVRLRVRDRALVERWIEESEERTKEV